MEQPNLEHVRQRVETTKVYRKTWLAINKGYRIIVHEGGTRSGKTWATLNALMTLATKYSGRYCTICSESLPHLRIGAMRDFYGIMGTGYNEKNHNKSDSTYNLLGNHFEFFGVDNEGKVRGPARDWLFINEANRVKEEIWHQLEPRTKELVFIDFNPDREFWAHELKGRNDVAWIHSTYLDNEMLDPRIVSSIESRKHLDNWWRVFGLGLLGNIENLIYTNWKLQSFDESIPFGYGLDFGFSQSQDALVKVAIDKKRMRIYLKELIYDHGNSTGDLRNKMRVHIKGNDLVVADSAENRLISELSSSFNVQPVSKYAGSVRDGIKILQDYEVCVDPGSENLVKELKFYKWKDRGAEIPEQGWDHLLDAARYYAMTMLSGRRRTKMV